MYSNILLPIDIGDKNSWKSALPQVIEMCKQSPDTKLTLMSVVQTYGLGMMEEYFPKNWTKEVTKKTQLKLEEIRTKHLPSDIKADLIVDKGVVYKSILDRAEKLGADLIVMVAHQPDRRDYLLGPNVAKVVRHSNTSVLVIRD